MKRPYIVGICGGSGSGKTFVLRKLMEALPAEHITLISQDNYYKEKAEQVQLPDGLVNYDHPESLDLDGYRRDIISLQSGKSIEVVEYTFEVPRPPQTFIFHPRPLIILEGLFIYHVPELGNLVDLKIYVDAEEHIKISRRLRRDIIERDYSMEETLRDYERFVAPMYKEYIAPQRMLADLIIPNNVHIEKAVEVLADHLKGRLT